MNTKVALSDSSRFELSEACLLRFQEILKEDGDILEVDAIAASMQRGGPRLPGLEAIEVGDSLLPNRMHPHLIQAIEELGLEAAAETESEIYLKKIPTILLSVAYIDDTYGFEKLKWNWADFLNQIVQTYDPDTMTLEDGQTILQNIQTVVEFDAKKKQKSQRPLILSIPPMFLKSS